MTLVFNDTFSVVFNDVLTEVAVLAIAGRSHCCHRYAAASVTDFRLHRATGDLPGRAG